MKKAIFFDWDGTLCVANEQMSDENKAALCKAKEQGHLLFLCTGRSYALVPKKSIAEVEFDGIVCGAGCYILIGDKLIFRNVLPEPIIKEIYFHFLEDGQKCFLEGEEKLLAVNYDAARYPHLTHLRTPEDFERHIVGHPITKLTLDGQMSDATKNLLCKYFTLVFHSDYQEAIPIGNNKATGIQRVLEYFGMDQTDSIAIGDSPNDLDMLRYAGLSIVMGNAPDEVKKEADKVSCRAEEHGVAEALNQWVLE